MHVLDRAQLLAAIQVRMIRETYRVVFRIQVAKWITIALMAVHGACFGFNLAIAIGFTLQAIIPDRLPFNLPLALAFVTVVNAVASGCALHYWRKIGLDRFVGL